MGWWNGGAAGSSESARRADVVKKAKAKIDELVDAGTAYNPAGVSDYTRNRGAGNATANTGAGNPIGRGTTSGGVAGRIIAGDAGTARTPADGQPTFRGEADYTMKKKKKKKGK